MGGGLVPHTFPQFLGAASVFLANLSKLGITCVEQSLADLAQISLEASFSLSECSIFSDGRRTLRSTAGCTPYPPQCSEVVLSGLPALASVVSSLPDTSSAPCSASRL
jgi:hypothetical protein